MRKLTSLRRTAGLCTASCGQFRVSTHAMGRLNQSPPQTHHNPSQKRKIRWCNGTTLIVVLYTALTLGVRAVWQPRGEELVLFARYFLVVTILMVSAALLRAAFALWKTMK